MSVNRLLEDLFRLFLDTRNGFLHALKFHEHIYVFYVVKMTMIPRYPLLENLFKVCLEQIFFISLLYKVHLFEFWVCNNNRDV